jgi:hypothetical protein
LRTNHKPLEWFTIVSNPNERQGRWRSMLQDFHFKIVHKLGRRHSNVDALNRNPIFVSNGEKDF